MASAIRGARAGAIRGWALRLLNRSMSVVIVVLDILGPVEPSSPTRDAIPFSWDVRVKRFAPFFVCGSLKKRPDTQFMGDTCDTVSGRKM